MAPAKSESIIMVLGVGGAGGNAVNHMFDLGIKDVYHTREWIRKVGPMEI